jgi:hypothetical protein
MVGGHSSIEATIIGKTQEEPFMTTLSNDGMLKVIQRGLAGHLTYISAVAGWGASSELALYPPIAAILLAREWDSRCQRPLPNAEKRKGAPRTIDFVARRRGEQDWEIAMEVKLLPTGRKGHEVRVAEDVAKLSQFKKSNKRANAYLLIVGRKIEIDKAYVWINEKRVDLKTQAPLIADLGRTAWGSVAIRL